MRISALQRLAQSAEAREDPLVAGMVESLMTQLKRAVANRDAGLLEAADTEARLEPDQVVVRGELAISEFLPPYVTSDSRFYPETRYE